MKVLFIHQNFPAQFYHLSAALAADPQHQVVALSIHQSPVAPGLRLRRYALPRKAQTEVDAQFLHGEACAKAAQALKLEGFSPDVIVAHSGWGEAIFIKDVFPTAKLIVYGEFYYDADGQDAGFDPEAPPVSFARRCTLRTRNTANLHSMEVADAALAPTEWQRSLFPAWVQAKMQVIHDGIDYARHAPQPGANMKLGPHGLVLRPGDEVLTYVARNLEPVRGFHIFMRMLPELLERRPKAHVIVVGNEGLSYSHAAPSGKSWKQHMLDEVGREPGFLGRLAFTGQLPHRHFATLLQISKVHLYWTTPFVLSWSFLEAAVSGVKVIASATPPVAEFAKDLDVRTENYFDQGAWAKAAAEELSADHGPRQQRQLDRIDLRHTTAQSIDFLKSML